MRTTRLILFLAAAFIFGASAWAGPRDAQWKSVEEAMNKGLPQTAITNLIEITSAALKEKAYPEAVKAIAHRIALEGNIQGNKPEERVLRLEAEIAKAPKEIAPVMQALLADWYWQYFQQNKWRFMQRTATAQAPGKDFTTWDLPRLFAEIDKHFQAALAHPAIRKSPVSAWDGLLVKGTMPDSYRPTLFDFLAYDALDFYTSGEQAAAKPEGAFELDANSPAFGSAREFMAWQPWEKTSETNSSAIRAIRLYQDLMRFHEKDPVPANAFAHADLERLTWAWNTAFGEEKSTRYKKALGVFTAREADSEISALAFERHAQVLLQESDPSGARAIATRGRDLFPESPGGKLCHNLIKSIEARSLNIVTERVWNAPWPNITLRYKNLDTVHFRAVPYRWEQFVEGRNRHPGNLTREEIEDLVKLKPALEWKETLASTPDFKERAAAVRAPVSLAKGYYFIVASPDVAFRQRDNQISIADVWVSELALVTRMRDGRIEGFVLQANSGEPVSGALVEPWRRDQEGRRVRDPDLRTDTNGFFGFKQTSAYSPWLLRVSHEADKLASAEDIHTRNSSGDRGFVGGRTLFFTDRSLYRPGQAIQYKGLSVNVDQRADNYAAAADREVTVIFQDPNGKEIARAKHKANAYGSFSGSFIAPRDRLMGQMRIHTEGEDGSTHIRVEEYKRPKFEVTLDRPKDAARLNDKVVLKGHATSYTGAAIDSAEVKYRIIREVQMPWWWGWWRGGGYAGQSQEIAHGKATTKTDGSFEITFEAKPDPKISPKDEPAFVYQAHADVTDSAGETRSANASVRVGYTALEARMSAGQWNTTGKPVEIRINTSSLDGEPQVAEGRVKIHALVQPAKVHRTPIGGADDDMNGTPDNDLSNLNNWELGGVVSDRGFTSDTNGVATLSITLGAGAYRAVLETQDRFGKTVTGRLPIQVVEPEAPRLALRIPQLFDSPRWEALPGEEFMALWGTGYDTGRAFIEIERRHEIVQRFWTTPGQTQQKITLAVTEAMRGGLTVHVTQVRENRGHLQSRGISVPWKNKELELKWEHFVSKLQPGQKETWTAVITKAPGAAAQAGTAAERSTAEMVATLYDASLDAFASHYWPVNFGVFHQNYSDLNNQFANMRKGFNNVLTHWNVPRQNVQITYRGFPPELRQRLWGYGWFGKRGRGVAGYPAKGMVAQEMSLMDFGAPTAPAAMPALAPGEASLAESKSESLNFFAMDSAVAGGADKEKRALGDELGGGARKTPALGEVAARKNLNETAFFFPHLASDSNGVVRITFTMPEALTKWRFMGLAHDARLRHGYLEAEAVTAKDLMVQPNPPRFLREGDEIEFTVKVSNRSDVAQTGTVRLTFTEAMTQAGADKPLGNDKTDQRFEIAPRESRGFSWRIRVPDGCGFLTYKAVAATDKLSDGEEGAVPVLSRRIFVTESLPLPIRGPATKQFEFAKLIKSGDSKTLRHENLKLQMVSNPAWYAVLALPYLIEFPHECSEQTFNRLYANALARDIANKDPKIRRIFDLWKNTPALDSPLEKNQDLKSVMLEETPWLREALSESNARKNVGILFDENRLDSEMQRTLEKLTQMQIGNGQWPWFPGGPGDDYITLYITTGFGRMRHLGVDVEVAPAVRSLARLDEWMTEQYAEIMRGPHPEAYVPSPTIALYLYGRGFFLKDMPVPGGPQKALEFFLTRSREHWLKTASRQTQAHLALALHRFAAFNKRQDATPQDIMVSMKQRGVSNEEMGMFWRDTEYSWSWIHAPIETQALMIEAFDEIAGDKKAVEDCKVWLLKQKQTQDWKTTKATADAVYALLLRGRDLLASDALVEVRLGGIDIKPRHTGPAAGSDSKNRFSPVVEPGTGFYEVRFDRGEIAPKLGKLTVRKTDEGVAWGALHWQYFEDISKVTPHEGTPLKLKKALFRKTNAGTGPVLEPVTGPLAVGDELVVRIELRTDRDMEYVHMKDQRGSGTEPVNVLSSYKYQDGLGYYESTRDTASHFFISYLPKGVYVFEYSTRVQLRGDYQTGMAEIQCMYAPEFNSHSQSIGLEVK